MALTSEFKPTQDGNLLITKGNMITQKKSMDLEKIRYGLNTNRRRTQKWNKQFTPLDIKQLRKRTLDTDQKHIGTNTNIKRGFMTSDGNVDDTDDYGGEDYDNDNTFDNNADTDDMSHNSLVVFVIIFMVKLLW